MSTVVYETEHGKEETKEKLEEVSEDLVEKIREELEVLVDQIVEDSIALCPKDTGSLASSIRKGEGGTLTASEPNTIIDIVISAGDPSIINPKTGIPTSEYVNFVHDGHAFKGGKGMYFGVPFLVEALMLHEDEIEELIDKALQELMSRGD